MLTYGNITKNNKNLNHIKMWITWKMENNINQNNMEIDKLQIKENKILNN